MSETTVRLRSKTIARFVAARGLAVGSDLERYLAPKLSHLSQPEAMADRAKCAQRLARAIREGEQIVVFGDYDCDGMTAAAILCDVIEELGGRCTPLLASRFDGGYGVSERALEKIRNASPDLVVTCDCGSSDHATLGQLTSAGTDVIVIDHHLVPAEPLPAFAFLNPHRPECGFAYKGLSSCGLVLSVAAALRAELGAKLDLRQWLDLVAIGTVADVAPLTDDNRALVRAGLSTLRNAERAGIRALLDVVGIDRSAPLSAADIAFRIAPRLNAPGRLQDPDLAFHLMRERDPERALHLAEQVEALCRRRREDQAKIEAEARAEVEASGQSESPAIVVGREGWNHGIVGIVAGRLAEELNRPTVVIGFEEGVGRGSLRGPDGFPLFDALSECAPHLNRFGGHQAAAGMEVQIEKLDAFRAAYQKACAARADYEVPLPPSPLEIEAGDDLSDVLCDLELLEPCGEQNPGPRLSLRCSLRSAREVRGGHLKVDLRTSTGRRVGGFGPGMGQLAETLKGEVCVEGELRPDRYAGGDAVEFLVRKIAAL